LFGVISGKEIIVTGPVITVNLSQFEATRTQLMNALVNLEKSLLALKSSHASLSATWEGQSGNAFRTAYEEIESSFTQNNTSLRTLISNMDMAEKGFTNIDSELAKLMAE
jgi:WXG100 family type VII secretion target